MTNKTVAAPYTDAKVLGAYVSSFYKLKYGREISPIKLQKSLVFLFAYWGAFARKANSDKTIEGEYKIEYLFHNKIEAWTYGYVIPDVHNEKLTEIDFTAVNKDIEIKKFIDDMLNDILAVSDFRLVDISHEDNSWKKNYDPNAKIHNIEVKKEELINEYTAKI
ncbi:MAG: hypothetical protein LBH47_00770 [Christensenellaceae bacterium]|jgi:uncharacterized phage-associated protein|nr:hypothetical protein [Christensenellaceae bacterium]